MGMFERDGKRFNCCESVIILVNEKLPLPGLDVGVMRAASNMGGGGAGWGSLCGAVSGGCMVYGMLMGTGGDEDPETFTSVRAAMRERTQVFLRAFEERWRQVNCFDLLGCDTRTMEGRRRHEENKAQGRYYCEEYVRWSAAKILELLNT